MDDCSSSAFSQLLAEGCEIVRSEKVPRASRDGRAELATVLDFLRLGDTLVVTRRDRLGTVLDPHVSTRGEMRHLIWC